MEPVINKNSYIKTFIVFSFSFVLWSQQQTPTQKVDGVAAIVGDRVVLSSDINQSLAMAVFQQKLDPKKDGVLIEELKNNITNLSLIHI